MRVTLLLGVGTLLGSAPLGQDLLAQRVVKTGRWEAELRWRPRQNNQRVLWIDFDGRYEGRRRDGGDFGFTMKVNQLTGLGADNNRWSGPATFELRRDAGALRFEGRFEDGLGEGTYRFEANDRFLKELDLVGADEVDDDELLAMLIHDVRTEWVSGLKQSGVKRIDGDDLLAMRIHDVTPEFVRDLAELGYRDLSPDRLVGLRVHDVSPDYIRQVRKDVDASADLDDILSFKIHRVTPDFVREIAQLGYPAPDADELLSMRIHGVTPSFIRSITAAGVKSIDLDELVSFRVHGIDAEFIKQAVDSGVGLDPDEIVDYRIHRQRWNRKRDR